MIYLVLMGCLLAGQVAASTNDFSNYRLQPRTYDLGQSGPSSSREAERAIADLDSRIKVRTGRVSFKELGDTSESSDSSSGWSSPLITPDSSPGSSSGLSTGSTSGNASPSRENSKSVDPNELSSRLKSLSIMSPKKPQIKVGKSPVNPSIRGYTNEDRELLNRVKAEDKLLKAYPKTSGSGKDAKGKSTVIGIGQLEATSDWDMTRTEDVGIGKAQEWSIRHHNMIELGGNTLGGIVKTKARGDNVVMRMQTGALGRGWYEDRRDPDLKHRRIHLQANQKVQKVFTGTKAQPAKIRTKVEANGSAKTVAINHPYRLEPFPSKEKEPEKPQRSIIQGGVQKYRKPK